MRKVSLCRLLNIIKTVVKVDCATRKCASVVYVENAGPDSRSLINALAGLDTIKNAPM